MDKIYQDLTNPGSLSSKEKLYQACRRNKINVSKADVEKFLESKDSYSLHKPNRYKFPKSKIYFPRPGFCVCIDTCYINRYKSQNVPFLVFIIDGYSRYLWIYPARSLKSNCILPILEHFFLKNIYSYRYCYTDMGTEYTNSSIQSFLRKNHIKWYTNCDKSTRNSIVERVILTIKRRLVRTVTHFNDEKFLDKIPAIVRGYNVSPHQGLNGAKPLDIHLMQNLDEISSFSTKLYKRYNRNMTPVKRVFSLGQLVRIQSLRTTFKRVTDNNFTREIFKIIKVNTDAPVSYNLSDLDGEIVKGRFYYYELSPVQHSGEYDIAIISTRKNRKGVFHLVKFVDYPNATPKWYPEKDLIQK